MPEVDNIDKAQLAILYTDIGRGHPSYLDGMVETLDQTYPNLRYLKTDVFSESSGLSLAAWQLVKKLYYWGARGGSLTSNYARLRRGSGAGKEGIMAGILGRSLRKRFRGFQGPVVVAHPILAGILSGQNRVIYQHGELAAPSESLVKGCVKILVPTAGTAAIFTASGIAPEIIEVTGQCVEPDLVAIAEDAFNQRIMRLDGEQPLNVALFSSGAYPREHLQKLRSAAASICGAGHNVFFFSGASKSVANNFIRSLQAGNIAVGTSVDDSAQVKVIRAPNRLSENSKVAAIFKSLDLFVAPAHERTNWAVGLGLPLFILEPHIGSYAPLNAKIALQAGVAQSIKTDDDARHLGRTIEQMRRDGRLSSMAGNGYGRTELSGFARCAEIIAALSGDK